MPERGPGGRNQASWDYRVAIAGISQSARNADLLNRFKVLRHVPDGHALEIPVETRPALKQIANGCHKSTSPTGGAGMLVNHC